MKKFTCLFIIMLFTITSVSLFAQVQNLQSAKMPADITQTDLDKAHWEGHTDASNVYFIPQGTEYAMRFTAGQLNAGDQITKIRFYSNHESWADSHDVTNQSYVIRVYEGGSFDEITGFAEYNDRGTEVYSQNYTATNIGGQEVDFTTPYEVGSGEFWISVEVSGGKGIMPVDLDEEVNILQNRQLYTIEHESEMFWLNNQFCIDDPPPAQGEDCQEFVFRPLWLAVFIDDGGTYEASSDLEAFFIDNETDQNIITSLNLEAEDSLIIFPVFRNLGPDNADEIFDFILTVDDVEAINAPLNPEEFPGGTFSVGQGFMERISLLSGEDMDGMELEVFDVCLEIIYYGNDPDLSNNIACLTVTRPLIIDVENNTLENISIFPNPASDNIIITNAENSKITILNILGKVVSAIENPSSYQDVDISSLSAGTYFVRIDSEVFKINVVK